MRVPFLKMHGLGNDFMIVDARALPDTDLALSAARVRAWADRRTGVGFDQLLTIDAPHSASALASYRIFNADGNAVEQCGNGVRCVVAALARIDGLPAPQSMTLDSPAGPVRAELRADGEVAVDMGVPDFSPAAIPLAVEAKAPVYTLPTDVATVACSALSVGNPHAVVFVDDVRVAPVADWGPALGASDWFPEGVNVGFAEIVDREHIRLRVFERGVGETQACGTGACAAMAAARALDKVDSPAQISLPGGTLMIDWRAPKDGIVMQGPATFSFEGDIEL